MDALTFIEKNTSKLLPLYVLFGDESFLKRQVLRALRQRVLGSDSTAPEDGDAGMSVYPGEDAEFAAVYDELHTAPLFSPKRLVVVDGADSFITRFRSILEKRIRDLPETGVLVLDVKVWQANTRLYKIVGPEPIVVCKSPDKYRLPQWCVRWSRTQHGKDLASDAAALLVEWVGDEMGLLDQEIEKLAIYVGERKRIESADVDALVGHRQAENTFKIFDAIGAGRASDALVMLDHLFEQGEEPLRILGAFSLQLRRLAQAGRLAQQGKTVRAALEHVGVPSFAVAGAEQQLRHLGRRRANRLYDQLLEINLGLKGGSALPERTLLERFVVELAAEP